MQFSSSAKRKLCVIDSVIDSKKMSSKEIDEKTSELMQKGQDIFVMNKDNLKKANPDLIISQNTCEVCAAHNNQVEQALQILEKNPSFIRWIPIH